MNITTRKRRSMKGVKWINHYYSNWYRRRRSVALIACATIAAQSASQLNIVRFTHTLNKIDKALAIAEIVTNTHANMLKTHSKMMGIYK